MLFPLPDDFFQKNLDVYNRIVSVIYLAAKIGCESDKHGVSKIALSAAFIRSSLCEFISLEEYISQTYSNLNEEIYKISKFKDPIFHMLKLLRNYNIHVESSFLAEKSMQVRTLIKDSPEYEIRVNYISNLNLSSIKSLKSGKYYTDDQILKMIECFENEQHEFGISTLIIKAALEYIERLRPYI